MKEISELRTRITDIDKSVGEIRALIALRESKALDLYKKVDAIHDCLIGTGDSNNPSVIVRLDRVEQIMDMARWFAILIGGLVINAIFQAFKHG